MSTTLECRSATAQDLPWIVNQLHHNNLPADDVDGFLGTFVVAEDFGNRVGVAGLEPHGRVALLRSMVVTPDHRRAGVGRVLWQAMEALACRLNMVELYLLTETAESFFSNLGFVTIPRTTAPEAIRNTRQFAQLCPASATLMQRSLIEQDGLDRPTGINRTGLTR